jgi:histidinol-phosphatase
MTFVFPIELNQCLDGRLATAVELAKLGGKSTLKYFQTTGVDVERKGDNSPVTIADKQAEQLIRAELAKRFPEDAILGEEFGVQEGTSEYQWIVDPIDGTKSFITGVPMYSTLIGVVRNRECLGGVIYIPALDEIVFAARGTGAWYSSGDQAPSRCSVSSRKLSHGLFVTTQLDSFGKRGAGEGYLKLEKAAYITHGLGAMVMVISWSQRVELR